MKMTDLFSKLRNRAPSKPKARDWTSTWTPRDWADLPRTTRAEKTTHCSTARTARRRECHSGSSSCPRVCSSQSAYCPRVAPSSRVIIRNSSGLASRPI